MPVSSSSLLSSFAVSPCAVSLHNGRSAPGSWTRPIVSRGGGHDFRPDYRYVGRFIRERAGDDPPPPVLCLTATAKPDVMDEIVTTFREELNISLRVLDGGARRTNLEFVVVQTSSGEKFAHIHEILTADLPDDEPGGAIVYCATRRQSEEGRGVPAGEGGRRGILPCRAAAGDQEERPG